MNPSLRPLSPLAAAAVLTLQLSAGLPSAALAAPTSILFVGNSYTFGRVDPVLTYNAANVRDLTQPQGVLHGGTDPSLPFVSGAPFTNLTGTNSYPVGTINPATGAEFTSYSPHSQTVAWGGVPGIFKQFTVQAGLDYDVALSTRNAASLRGHFLNTANPNWDLRGNIASQRWDQVVLQEQSDEALGPRSVPNPAGGTSVLNSNFPAFQAYANLVENYIHQGTALSYRERDLYTAIHGSQANCVAAGGTTASCSNNTLRTIAANPNANAAAEIFLMQAWARPNLVNPPGTNTIDPRSGDAIYNLSNPAPSFFSSLSAFDDENSAAFERALDFADNDGSGGFAGIAPVGQAFLRAIADGVATADMYAPTAASDGLVDLWFNDGTHASVHGSYLSALTLFGRVTGVNPLSLGAAEIAARELGITAAEAVALQRIAALELGFSVPLPGSAALALAGLLLLVGVRRRPTPEAAQLGV
jgi:hypothetical protein